MGSKRLNIDNAFVTLTEYLDFLNKNEDIVKDYLNKLKIYNEALDLAKKECKFETCKYNSMGYLLNIFDTENKRNYVHLIGTERFDTNSYNKHCIVVRVKQMLSDEDLHNEFAINIFE